MRNCKLTFHSRPLHFIGYKHSPEYYFKFLRFYVIIHQRIDLKRTYSTYRCPFYWESEAFVCWTNKKKTATRFLGWIAEIAASQVGDRKGNAFIMEKIVKKLFLLFSLLFKHFGITKHWNYLLIGQFVVWIVLLKAQFPRHTIWTLRQSCHLAVYKLKKEGKINYFHSKTFLGLTDTS